MSKRSAGLLMFRLRDEGEPEVLLVHPGGPYWRTKDKGAWSIPKGELAAGEEPLQTAKREFYEETGCRLTGAFLPLTSLRQPGGKLVYAWAVEGDCDVTSLKSNSFTLEWPSGSGKTAEFPEIDRGAWFTFPAAREKILPGQRAFLEELEKTLQDGEVKNRPRGTEA